MKNRKFAALVLTTLALGTLAGCGKKDQPEQNQTQAEQSATESTEKADASSEAAEVKTIRSQTQRCRNHIPILAMTAR